MMVKKVECFGYVRDVMLQEFCWVKIRPKARIYETWNEIGVWCEFGCLNEVMGVEE